MTAINYSILDDLADDPGVINARKMAAIYTAILDAASLAGGRFSAPSVRPMLPPHLTDDPRVGAAFSALVSGGIARKTGTYVLSGNTRSRNAQRPVCEYIVTDWNELEKRAACVEDWEALA